MVASGGRLDTTAGAAPTGVVWEVVRESGITGAVSTLRGVSLLSYERQSVEIEAIAVLE